MILAQKLLKDNPDSAPLVPELQTKQRLLHPYSVGVEFELENMGQFAADRIDKRLWAEHQDGSLRGLSIEYVMAKPLKNETAIMALENIYDAANGDMEPFSSPRTSAHVHVNALDLTTEQAVLYALAGTIAEPFIYSITDEYRKYSGFCADSKEASIKALTNVLKGRRIDEGIRSRYFGINQQSLYRHGTLEFRHFSLPFKLEDAVRNINVCLELKNLTTSLVGPKTEVTAKNVEDIIVALQREVNKRFGATGLVRDTKSLLASLNIQMHIEERFKIKKTSTQQIIQNPEGYDLSTRPTLRPDPLQEIAQMHGTVAQDREELRTTLNQVAQRPAPINPDAGRNGRLLSEEAIKQAALDIVENVTRTRRDFNRLLIPDWDQRTPPALRLILFRYKRAHETAPWRRDIDTAVLLPRTATEADWTNLHGPLLRNEITNMYNNNQAWEF